MDGELVEGSAPIPYRFGPLLGDILQRQEVQLGGCLVGGESASGLEGFDRLAVARIA